MFSSSQVEQWCKAIHLSAETFDLIAHIHGETVLFSAYPPPTKQPVAIEGAFTRELRHLLDTNSFTIPLQKSEACGPGRCFSSKPSDMNGVDRSL